MDLTAGCTVFMGSSAGVAAASGESSVRSKDVNPDSCAGRLVSGAGISLAAAGEGKSLPKVRSSSVNPALPLPPDSRAGAFSAMGTLSADAIRIRSSSSGELSAPPPNTTLCTVGSASAFGPSAGSGFAASGAQFSRTLGSAPEPAADPSTGSGAFTN
jgi:hypothetical protein